MKTSPTQRSLALMQKPNRKAKKSPNALSSDLLKSRGYAVDIVERTIPHTFIKKDLFGCFDLVYLAETICGVQATSDDTGGNSGQRRAKILASLEMLAWLKSGGRIFIHAWAERGDPKAWRVKETEITRSDFEAYKCCDALRAVCEAKESA